MADWLTKHKTTPLDKLDPKIKQYLGGLPPDLQKAVLITATSDGEHTKGSLHYSNKAVDLRYNEQLWNYISKDENRHKSGLTLIDPNHGSARHIHLSDAKGTKNEIHGEVDKVGREKVYKDMGWDLSVLGKQSTTDTQPQQIISQPIMNTPQVDTRVMNSVQQWTPDIPVETYGEIIQDKDFSNFNNNLWLDGHVLKKPIREDLVTRKKQAKSVVDNLEDSPLKDAMNIILDDIDGEDEQVVRRQRTRRQDDVTTSNQNVRSSTVNSVGGGGNSKQGMYNAGNIRDSKGGFKSFSSPEEGRQALENQLNLYKTGKTSTRAHPDMTLYEAMEVYAPASDNNKPKQYAEFIAKKAGVSPNIKIKDMEVSKWADAVELMEGNKSYLNNKKENGGWLSRFNK